MAEIDRDRAGMGVFGRRADAADDTGSGAERDGGGACVGAPIEHGGNVVFVAREGDDVRRVRKIAIEDFHQFGKGFAIGVGGAVIGIGGADFLQALGRLQSRGLELDLVDRRNRSRVETVGFEMLRPGGAQIGLFLRRQAIALVAPAVELETFVAHVCLLRWRRIVVAVYGRRF